MKQKITLLTLLLLANFLLAQVCGTPEPTNSSQTLRTNQSNNNLTSVCLNIYFHIVRDNNGNGGINQNQIPLIMDDLNNQYNNLGIFFINSGIGFIDNTSYQNIGGETEAENLGQVNNLTTAINYYIVDNLWNTSFGQVLGTANNIPSNNLVIRRDEILTSTSAHEIGHCLDLYHTFQGTASGTSGCAEAVDGSNCLSCGDLVCDTPADANVGNSGGYSPDLNNIMSYYTVTNNLTIGQSSRMLDAINNSPLLNQTISSSCAVPELSSSDLLCYPNSETLTINNIDNYIATWQTSSNLQIISFTASSVTIKPDNSFVSGFGWVEATLNSGLVLRDEFWIGGPTSNGLVIYSSGDFEISTQRWYQLTSHHSNFNYLEHGSLEYEWQIPYAQLRQIPPKNKIISVFPTQTGTYPYKLRSKNDCGCSPWITKLFQVLNQPGDDDLFISPAGN